MSKSLEMNERKRAVSDRVVHRENVYVSKSTTDVSWFESEPTISLQLIECLLPQGGRIIDVGGLEAVLGGGFSLVKHNQVSHITPAKKTQEFTLAVFQKI